MTADIVDEMRDSGGRDVSYWRPMVARRLAAWSRQSVVAEPPARRAAVAVTLIDRPVGAHVLLIKRVRRGLNPGHWALPGGKIDGEEGFVAAALRELHEETGLSATADDVLGVLDDYYATSCHVITPVVVALAGMRSMRRRAIEVASLHPIPVARLLGPGMPRWKATPSGERLLQMPLRHDMVVHAPTGAILWQFAEVGLRGVPRRIADLAEPHFTAH
jgi:8-oxo-dGTP pyrophosphatase MutT (NUDIX family)